MRHRENDLVILKCGSGLVCQAFTRQRWEAGTPGVSLRAASHEILDGTDTVVAVVRCESELHDKQPFSCVTNTFIFNNLEAWGSRTMRAY